jgi:menaquinone-dependent protoporphyrinogen oxidase
MRSLASDARGVKDVLVAYASKHGSTAEIAGVIATELAAAGLTVDCREVSQVGATQHYDAVVVGSAVYMGRWRPEARHFLRLHRKALAQQLLYVFSSGPVGSDAQQPGSPALEPRRIVRSLERLGAREHVVFAGSLPGVPAGRLMRAAARNTPPELRDRRDLDQIKAWAARIAGDLGARSRLAS